MALNFNEWMMNIGMPEDVQPLVAVPMDTDVYQYWKNLFETDFLLFMENLRRRKDADEFALRVYSRFAYDAHTSFQRRGISDQIYYDTCSDIAIWCRDAYEKTGKWGLHEQEWVSKSIKQQLYRIGRLQYEPLTESNDELKQMFLPECDLSVYTKILNVHIPAEEPLTPEEVSASMHSARKLFPDADCMVCVSWLLSPELQLLLPAGSNILSFQKRFHVVKTIHPFRQAEERVFGCIKKDISSYSENTYLQKTLKKYLLDKKEPGIGLGCLALCK
ncbi:MAG: acyltransferase domain-containing protein [Eubacterium sp.]|nr:acyltransferase domain-containing protein [Eubacterium sp.]